jgi:hypothetical protein
MPIGIGKITCDIHGGELKRRESKCWWECVGWDGEGCCHLTDEDIDCILGGTPLPTDCDAFGVRWARDSSGSITWIRVKVRKSPEETETQYKQTANNETGSMATWQELDD